MLFVFVHELVDPSCAVNQLTLAGVKGVRSIGDLKLYQGILLTIFHLDGIVGIDSGFGHERGIV
jgi:hypothetical protein